ncbi:Hsp20/alpha crystallin family protein [Leptolyngbya cf. ectocarpi LEGE 11479]|uniref:Hsp20/alpha crystallin family protein n=1 Tax=Leptolyngbya cf. ectocarpi LEGE 11479 TaxID=1828722 RepID=A0A929FAI5_LEPEC|nr:Hsp20/alpha crystallin family protein [Leptolyngbya ectocarpi]MBE9068214.1 Hsp20/alpha crystallin family protein [Leptolyngbya cf. ectocarpi LEGE 11479]
MIVRYWQPFHEIETIRQQLDNIFEDLTPTATDWIPAVDLVDAGDGYSLEVVLPGLKAENINIEASRKSVTISGERTAPEVSDDQQVLRRERRYGSFRRVVNLPVVVDHEQVKADYSNGILTVHVPKTAEVRNQVVKVNVAETPAD